MTSTMGWIDGIAVCARTTAGPSSDRARRVARGDGLELEWKSRFTRGHAALRGGATRRRAVVPDGDRAQERLAVRSENFASSGAGLAGLPAVSNDNAARGATFVDFFRQASPYIALHRGSTFVVLIPGDVSANKLLMESIVTDVALLHDLGVRVVLVVGASDQVSELTRMRGGEVRFVDDYRVTDEMAMEAAMEANGRNQVMMQAMLSRAPTIAITRRHRDGDSDDGASASNGANIVATSGNYIFAKRMGTVNGTDFQRTGEVTRVDARGIKKKLSQGDIVLLSSLGFNAAGEVLNCQSFDVALATAIDLKADKLIVMTDPSHMPYNETRTTQKELLDATSTSTSASPGRVPRFLPLRSAEAYLARTYGSVSGSSGSSTPKGANWRWLQINYSIDGSADNDDEDGSARASANASLNYEREHLFDSMRGVNESISRFEELMERGLSWRVPYCPQELCLATFACKAGVRRAHLVDPTISGSLLVELYTRDGIGCMVARDRYEGTRLATLSDWESIRRILEPLVETGTVIQRSDEELTDEIQKEFFHVTERDGKVIACCALKPCGDSDAYEVAAFAVSPEYRRGGRGDALLEYAENYASEVLEASRLFLLTTRTADWFVHRGFENKGLAENNLELPKGKQVQPGRGSVLFMKTL